MESGTVEVPYVGVEMLGLRFQLDGLVELYGNFSFALASDDAGERIVKVAATDVSLSWAMALRTMSMLRKARQHSSLVKMD